jgi:hypothetical protein
LACTHLLATLPRLGHCLAFEVPRLAVQDVIAFARYWLVRFVITIQALTTISRLRVIFIL